MNDIFKLFKKRAQAGKSTNISDVIKDLPEKEQTEMMSDVGGKFDRTHKSYLSISKSGRLKSKKSQSSRALQEDLFLPASAVSIDISSNSYQSSSNPTAHNINNYHNHHNHHSNNLAKSTSAYEPLSMASSRLKPIIYDQNSDNADSRTSSTSSSFRSSCDESPQQLLPNRQMIPNQSNLNRMPARHTNTQGYYQPNQIVNNISNYNHISSSGSSNMNSYTNISNNNNSSNKNNISGSSNNNPIFKRYY
jgi:hypothetical protein